MAGRLALALLAGGAAGAGMYQSSDLAGYDHMLPVEGARHDLTVSAPTSAARARARSTRRRALCAQIHWRLSTDDGSESLRMAVEADITDGYVSIGWSEGDMVPGVAVVGLTDANTCATRPPPDPHRALTR